MAVHNRIIALTGLPASGKSTIASHLRDQYGFNWIRTRDVVTALGADGSLADLQRRGLSLSDGEGADAFLAELASRVDASRNTVVDAIRPVAHWRMLAARFPNCVLVGVLAPTSVRATRFASREGGGDVVADLAARDSHPVESEVPTVTASADYIVVNVDEIEYRTELMLAFAFRDALSGPLSALSLSYRVAPRGAQAEAHRTGTQEVERAVLEGLRCL